MTLTISAFSFFIVNAQAFTVGNKLEGKLSHVKSILSSIHRHANLTGHEEITRQAIVLAKDVAKKNNIEVPKLVSLMAFRNLDSEEFGLIGSDALNPLIQGNYATDFPFTKKYVVSLPEYWGFKDIKEDMQWQDHPETQKFHFLRNHLSEPNQTGSILVGQRQSCINTRDAIVQVTKEASYYFNKHATSFKAKEVNTRKSLFFLGHATHMLQDSFSEAHGRRHDRHQNHDIREVCYFGFDLDLQAFTDEKSFKKRLNSCHHSASEIVRDGIWIRDSHARNRVHTEWPVEKVIDDTPYEIQRCVRNFSMKVMDNEKCLKHTPRLARTATAKYLLVMMAYLQNSEKEEIGSYLKRTLFEGSLGLSGIDETMPNGVLRCGNLPTL